MNCLPRSQTRQAMTLVEILIGLAVVVASAMLAWPVISGAFSIHRLRSAGETVEGACAEARLQAINTGQIYAFRFQTETPNFLVEAVPQANQEELLDFSDIDAPPSTGDLRPINSIDWTQEGQALPDDVSFVTIEARTDDRDVMLNELMPGDLNAPQKPLLFYPDGTTSNATIILHNQAGYYIEVVLDGLAGTVVAGEPYKTKAVGNTLQP